MATEARLRGDAAFEVVCVAPAGEVAPAAGVAGAAAFGARALDDGGFAVALAEVFAALAGAFGPVGLEAVAGPSALPDGGRVSGLEGISLLAGVPRAGSVFRESGRTGPAGLDGVEDDMDTSARFGHRQQFPCRRAAA